mmetsp:Transcript_79401/g.222999  ORF Transcript_79401/g.222999 Transcript_79401/m.222999 type:complete len:126 (-) Transcript_79401:762-1139(-)
MFSDKLNLEPKCTVTSVGPLHLHHLSLHSIWHQRFLRRQWRGHRYFILPGPRSLGCGHVQGTTCPPLLPKVCSISSMMSYLGPQQMQHLYAMSTDRTLKTRSGIGSSVLPSVKLHLHRASNRSGD